MRSICLFSCAVLLSITTCFAQNADINLLWSINKNETAFKNTYMGASASSSTALSIAVPASIAIAGFISHNNKLKRDALYMAGSFAFSALVTQSLKHIIDRPRPFEKYTFITKRDDESRRLSFPSGHTSSAFCTATDIALRYRKWYFVVPAYAYAASVGWARMYQGVHYPTDVLAGAIAGAGSAWLVWKVQKWIQKKQLKKR